MIETTEIELLNKNGKSVKIVDCGDVDSFDTFGGDKISDVAECPKKRHRRNDSKKKDGTSVSGRQSFKNLSKNNDLKK